MQNLNQNSDKFVVLFIPETHGGVTMDELKANIQRLFNMHDEKINSLFVGKPVVIKSGADEDTALTYKRAIERSGGSCWVEPEQEEEFQQMTA